MSERGAGALTGLRDELGEAEFLRSVLEQHRGNVTRAARAMDITRGGIWKHLRRLGMNRVPAEIRKRHGVRFSDPTWLRRGIEGGETPWPTSSTS